MLFYISFKNIISIMYQLKSTKKIDAIRNLWGLLLKFHSKAMSCTIKLLITRLKKNWTRFTITHFLTFTRAIRGVRQKKKIYQKLGLDSHRAGRWNFWLFYKVLRNEHPQYFSKLISPRCTFYSITHVIRYTTLSKNFSFTITDKTA